MSKKMISMLLTFLFTCLFLFFYLVSLGLNFSCMAHAFFPKCLSNHSQGPVTFFFSKFAQNLMLFLCQIYCRIVSGQIHDSTWKEVKNQHIHPAAWNSVCSLPRYDNTVICSISFEVMLPSACSFIVDGLTFSCHCSTLHVSLLSDRQQEKARKQTRTQESGN
jgi:hypothetical protein